MQYVANVLPDCQASCCFSPCSMPAYCNSCPRLGAKQCSGLGGQQQWQAGPPHCEPGPHHGPPALGRVCSEPERQPHAVAGGTLPGPGPPAGPQGFAVGRRSAAACALSVLPLSKLQLRCGGASPHWSGWEAVRLASACVCLWYLYDACSSADAPDLVLSGSEGHASWSPLWPYFPITAAGSAPHDPAPVFVLLRSLLLEHIHCKYCRTWWRGALLWSYTTLYSWCSTLLACLQAPWAVQWQGSCWDGACAT